MKNNPIRQEYAKLMRRNPTLAERSLWRELRDRRLAGYKFRRQQQLGYYIADFVCYEAKLIVELDGDIHDSPLHEVNDSERSEALNKLGFRVIRFWNDDVFDKMSFVLKRIQEEVQKRLPSPPTPLP
ncbi:MAG: endonuclease domain-containing protein [Candidatus Cloacimonetes bacterium]|nr:endonuclease domain-containing protein [Candidatus Cloacimonadota bacterium]